jgi:hypothetical protein
MLTSIDPETSDKVPFAGKLALGIHTAQDHVAEPSKGFTPP